MTLLLYLILKKIEFNFVKNIDFDIPENCL